MLTGKTQSQSQKKYYHTNVAINCLHAGLINRQTKSIYENALPLVIPQVETFDIDNEIDFNIIKR